MGEVKVQKLTWNEVLLKLLCEFHGEGCGTAMIALGGLYHRCLSETECNECYKAVANGIEMV